MKKTGSTFFPPSGYRSNSMNGRNITLSILSFYNVMPKQICILSKNKSHPVVLRRVSLSKYWSVFAFCVPQAGSLLPVLFSFESKLQSSEGSESSLRADDTKDGIFCQTANNQGFNEIFF